MKLLIRTLHGSDLPALLALYRELHPDDEAATPENARHSWQQMLAMPGLQVLGGFQGATLASSCTLLVIPNLTHAGRPYALIENVVTATAFRRKGCGRAVLEAAAGIAREAGCYKLMLQTGRLDAATFAFYETCGFSRHAKQAFLMRFD